MVTKHKKKSSEDLLIAYDHINRLFSEADDIFNEDPSLADKYVLLGRKIAMKFKIKLKSEYRRKFCKHCYAYFRPSVTCRVRTQNGKIVYTCLKCKKFTRIPIDKK